MSEIRFLVQGSAEDPYETLFIKDGNGLAAFCTCPAGSHGQYCKHRFAILSGDGKAVVSDNPDDVGEVVNWLAGTELESVLRAYAIAEKQLSEAKRRLAQIKKTVAHTMMSKAR